MPLSKEFYLDEIKSKYPNSYNESLKDLPIKDLEDMLDFLEGALSKADGGSIGIEVLFGPKRGEYQTGGPAYDSRATAQDFANALQNVGGGTQAQKRQDLSNYLGNLISAGGQKIGNAVTIPLQAAKGVLGIQGTPITDSMQASLQKIIQDKVSKTGKLKGGIDYRDYGVKTTTGKEFEGFGDRSFTDPEAALATTLGQADYVVDPKTGKVTFTGGTAYDFRDDQFGGLGKFISKGGFFNQLPSPSNKFEPGATEYNPDITLGSDFMKQFNKTPLSESDFYSQFYGVPYQGFENKFFKTVQQGDPNYDAIRAASSAGSFSDLVDRGIIQAYTGPTDYKNYLSTFADGGRVGLFMGGPPLEGQALSIYDSMNAYGFTDQQIADALSARGLYTPSGSGTTQPEQVTGIINKQINQGGDNFSPFNPDPNKIQPVRQDPKIQANLEAIQRNQALQGMGIQDPFASEMNPGNEYYGDMMEIDLSPGKQSMFAKAKEGLSGIVGNVKGLMDNPVMNAIGFAINPFVGGIKGIASFANKMLPTNERAFVENAAGNLGIFVDDIGRIVNTGDYMDPNNIMAGYNLNMINANTFQKRIDRIRRGRLSEEKKQQRIDIIREAQRKIEAAQKLARLQAEQANLAKGRAPSGGRFDGGSAAYTNPNTGVGGGQFTDSLGNVDYQDAYDPGGGEKDGGIIGYRKGGLATMFKRKR